MEMQDQGVASITNPIRFGSGSGAANRSNHRAIRTDAAASTNSFKPHYLCAYGP